MVIPQKHQQFNHGGIFIFHPVNFAVSNTITTIPWLLSHSKHVLIVHDLFRLQSARHTNRFTVSYHSFWFHHTRVTGFGHYLHAPPLASPVVQKRDWPARSPCRGSTVWWRTRLAAVCVGRSGSRCCATRRSSPLAECRTGPYVSLKTNRRHHVSHTTPLNTPEIHFNNSHCSVPLRTTFGRSIGAVGSAADFCSSVFGMNSNSPLLV